MEPEEDLIEKELRHNREEADKKLTEALNAIFKKSAGELNSVDKEFLYARRDILSREQRDNYRGVFKQVEGWHAEKKAREEAEALKANDSVVEGEFEDSNPHPGEEDDGQDETVG